MPERLRNLRRKQVSMTILTAYIRCSMEKLVDKQSTAVSHKDNYFILNYIQVL